MTNSSSTPVPAQPTSPAWCWAEVRARSLVIRYRRSGTGRPVLVLRPPGQDATALWPELVEALAARYRLIVPELSAVDAAVAACLVGFLEGIGSEGVAVVAADPFELPTLVLAAGDTDQIASVVLAPGVHEFAAACGDDRVTRACVAGLPVLVVPRALASSVALPLIVRFLDQPHVPAEVPGVFAED